jgi:hypothetical protein
MATISLENRLLIHEFIAEYAHHVDNYRGEEWAAMFVEGGKLIGFELDVIAPQDVLKLVSELKAGVTEYRHSITNVYLDENSNDDEATAYAYGLVTDWGAKPARLPMFVEYRFNMIRQNSRWKILELRADMQFAKPRPKKD